MVESPKCSFMLITGNLNDLPAVSPCKFSAPKILRAKKLYTFVYEKLLEGGFVDPANPAGLASPEPLLQPALALLELFCNDQKARGENRRDACVLLLPPPLRSLLAARQSACAAEGRGAALIPFSLRPVAVSFACACCCRSRWI